MVSGASTTTIAASTRSTVFALEAEAQREDEDFFTRQSPLVRVGGGTSFSRREGARS